MTRKEEILELLENSPGLAANSIAAYTGISLTGRWGGVYKYLNELEEEGKIKHKNYPRKWYVQQKEQQHGNN